MLTFLLPGVATPLVANAGILTALLSPDFENVNDCPVTFTATLSGAFQSLVIVVQITDGQSWQTVATWDVIASGTTFTVFIPRGAQYQLACTAFASSGGFNCSVSATAASGTVIPPPLVKGVQSANGLTVQRLSDAGRTFLTLTALAAAGVTAEALLTFSQNKQGVVTAGVTSYVIPSGKTLRITNMSVSVRAAAAAVPFSRCILRHNTAGATVVGSPVAYILPEAAGTSAVAGAVGNSSAFIPDGLEIFGDGTRSIGMSHLDQAVTNILNVTICGFEY